MSGTCSTHERYAVCIRNICNLVFEYLVALGTKHVVSKVKGHLGPKHVVWKVKVKERRNNLLYC
jgi:hypothetical protein